MNREVCSLIYSIRDQPKLAVRGYLFVKNKSKNDTYYWNCELKKSNNCKGTAVTVLEGEEHVLKKFSEHGHTPDATRVDVVQSLNTVKETAIHTHDNPVQIIQDVMTNMPQDSSYCMPNKEAMRKLINRTRNKNIPAQPQSLQGIDVPTHLCRTLNGSQQFLAKEIELDEEYMMIFCTTANLQYLQDAKFWLMDGTFRTVPTLFQQLYTIHVPVGGEANSRILPMVYVLMTSRSEEMYKRLFEELIELADQAGYDLSPSIVITDFEQAVINATQSEFPDSTHKGCFFHLCQSLWRKIQSEGLSSEYARNKDFSLKMRHLTALAFLPPSEIPEAFDQIKLLLPENAAGIIEYFEKNYVRGRVRQNLRSRTVRRAAPLFPPEIWSVNDLVEMGYPRTQNVVEG